LELLFVGTKEISLSFFFLSLTPEMTSSIVDLYMASILVPIPPAGGMQAFGRETTTK